MPEDACLSTALGQLTFLEHDRLALPEWIAGLPRLQHLVRVMSWSSCLKLDGTLLLLADAQCSTCCVAAAAAQQRCTAAGVCAAPQAHAATSSWLSPAADFCVVSCNAM